MSASAANVRERIASKNVQISVPGLQSPIAFSKKTHSSLIDLVQEIQRVHKSNEEFRDKLTIIDLAYYRYQELGDDEEVKKLLEESGVQFEIPILISQVDTIVAYLADLFIDPTSIFKVISTVEDREVGEQVEALIDDHAQRGRWARHIQLFAINSAKYNFAGLEFSWSPIGALHFDQDPRTIENQNSKSRVDTEFINRLYAPDPYNTFWDSRVTVPEVAEYGEFNGWNEIWSRNRLKYFISQLKKGNELTLNISDAFNTAIPEGEEECYFIKPQVSKYVGANDPTTGTNWDAWMDGIDSNRRVVDYRNCYLVSTIYVRLIPRDHGLAAPEPETPQLWKLVVVNNSWIIHIKKVISPYAMSPFLLGQMREDGFDVQTESVAEQQMTLQDTVSELVNIRLNGARRSLDDRAIYNPTLVDPTSINTKAPAAKIPLKQNLASGDARQAYFPIPFDDRGTQAAIGDINLLLSVQDSLGGLNPIRRGQTLRGNRTLGEVNEVEDNSESRSKILATTIEYQVFVPGRRMFQANIIQHVDTQKLLHVGSGRIITTDPAKIREAILSFKLTDGYTPKGRLAGTTSFLQLIQLILTVPEVAQQMDLNEMVIHLGSILGIPDLDKFRKAPGQQPPPAPRLPAGGPPTNAS